MSFQSSIFRIRADNAFAGIFSARHIGGRIILLLASAAWLACDGVTVLLPDLGDWGYGREFAAGASFIAFVFITGIFSPIKSRFFCRLRHSAPWALTLGVVFAAWEVLTAKTATFPMPFFPPPHAILEVFIDDWAKLAESVFASLRLLSLGVVIGAGLGFATGLATGWSKAIGYWIHPVLRFVGPVPAIAWLPIAFFVFPSSWSASIFLISLAVGFPIAVLTWSGVTNIDKAYYDVARTLGADTHFLILKVAIPAALPQVFVGAFMGLGASFAVLVTAEMMGVKAGLGFYLQWAQGWAAYSNMYAALLLMTLMCTSLVTLLFKLRDKLLRYQKGALKW